MAVRQKPRNRLSAKRYEIEYVITGAASLSLARAEMLADAPLEITESGETLKRRTSEAEVEETDSSTVFNGTVYYETSENDSTTNPPDSNGSRYAFQVGGGTQHITQSLGTVTRYAAEGYQPHYYENAIGVRKDGDKYVVDGVDIQVPTWTETRTKVVESSDLTSSYLGDIYRLCGKVNSGSFKHFSAGECLFLGCTGNQISDGEYELSFNFGGSPNVSSLLVGNGITVDKDGWDYLWVEYAQSPEATGWVIKPIRAFVERVYYRESFAPLDL